MKEIIREEIALFMIRYREEQRTETSWRAPLVGFASASDPLFPQFKSTISPTHWLPGDLLSVARTVVVFFLPFDASIVRSNMEGRLASRQWAKSYIETNAVIAAIAEHMKRFLEEAGYVVFTTPATHNFDREKLMSDWSHRHAAYVAGLGKFGVNNMLITASGCCGRLGSFLTSLAVDPDERDATEACLHRRGIPCLRCVSRCVNNALFEDGFDRKRCYTMCLENGRNFREIGKADVCGKCLVGLPCSLSIPVSGRKAVE